MLNFEALRKEYTLRGLDEAEMAADPLSQLERWLDEASRAGLPEPNALVLASATPDGQPSARTVLLKGYDTRGLVFYSNYTSRKGRELAANPRAAGLFLWIPLERQVRVEGLVEQVSPAESDAYFASRPVGAQLGAWASPQSTPLASRAELEQRLAVVAAQFGDGPIPRPPHWGGYRLVPEQVEFWQGRVSRLHDRLQYQRTATGWSLTRLAP